MTLGDRVAVMRAGVLQQVGVPAELYNEPVNLFVAGFIGSPSMNFMRGEGRGRTRSSCRSPTCRSRARTEAGARRRPRDGKVIVGIRPGELRGRLARRRCQDKADVPSGQDRPDRVDGLRALRLLPGRGDEGASQTSSPTSPRTPASPRSQARGRAPVVARLDASSKVKRGEEIEVCGRRDKAPPLRPGERRQPQGLTSWRIRCVSVSCSRAGARSSSRRRSITPSSQSWVRSSR